MLTEEIKRYGGIKASIKEQSDLLDRIREENDNLIEKGQNLSILCQNAVMLINMVNSYYYYYKGFFDYYEKTDRSEITNCISPLIVILFYYNIRGKQDTKEKRDDNDSDLLP